MSKLKQKNKVFLLRIFCHQRVQNKLRKHPLVKNTSMINLPKYELTAQSTF